MPKGYMIARAIVTNPTAWAEYVEKACEIARIYGGTYIVLGGRCEVVEGEARVHNAVAEFENLEAARAYVYSAEHKEACKLREHAGVVDMIIIEGT